MGRASNRDIPDPLLPWELFFEQKIPEVTKIEVVNVGLRTPQPISYVYISHTHTHTYTHTLTHTHIIGMM